MNTNLSMPSGSEVESAVFHEAVPMRSSGLRGKIDSLKEQGLAKVHHMQHMVGDRSLAVRRSLERSVGDSKTKMQTSMQTNPMKWAGIAAGSGLAIGLLGRLMQARNRRLSRLPQLIVIEASC